MLPQVGRRGASATGGNCELLSLIALLLLVVLSLPIVELEFLAVDLVLEQPELSKSANEQMISASLVFIDFGSFRYN